MRLSKLPSTVCLVLCTFFLISVPLSSQSYSRTSDTAASFYEKGRSAMADEDWYTAAEAFLESININPSYSESIASLAEAYYALGEFDQALSWVRKARSLARGRSDLANLEAFILCALGKLDAADSVVKEVLSREPYNKEALFASAELDVARGKAGDAATRYKEAARRYPDDRRALLSLALVLGSLGDFEGSRSYVQRAVAKFPDDERVLYYSAYLDATSGRLDAASRSLEAALVLKPGYPPARSLLASVRYRSNRFEEAARLADEAIAANRSDLSAWYLKGMAFARLNRLADARSTLSLALSIDPSDEFSRAALEDLIIMSTPIESIERQRWARWHFDRARDYLVRNLADQALFEYRRGLRLDPNSASRSQYAELLRSLGYPERQLSELRFMQELGKADRAVNDAVETYESLLADALYKRWSVDPIEISSRHWKVAVVSIASQSASLHVDAGPVAANFVRDLLSHEGNIKALDIDVRQSSFSTAFRSAREAGADYFLVVSATESGRDLSLHGKLYVARTGSVAASFSAFRTGSDRLRNSARRIVDSLSAALPFRASLVQRKAGLALIDKGKMDGVSKNSSYEIVRANSAFPKSEGLGLAYSPQDVVGTLVIDEVDEQISMGTLARSGFFDRIAAGDEVLVPAARDPESKKGLVPELEYADPELRSLLRSLR